MIKRFVDYLRYERNYSEMTISGYVRDLEKFQEYFRAMDEALTWETIDSDIIRGWMEQMMDDGLLEEARKVCRLRGLNALNTVGYKELFEHFDGLTTLDEAVFKIQSNSRRYCRKQLTWFKRDDTLAWFEPENIKEIIKYIENNR